MSANLSSLLYLLSGVFFILSLRGLSGPETARQGNYFGMVGMAIAVATTLALLDNNTLESFGIIAGGVATPFAATAHGRAGLVHPQNLCVAVVSDRAYILGKFFPVNATHHSTRCVRSAAVESVDSWAPNVDRI